MRRSFYFLSLLTLAVSGFSMAASAQDELSTQDGDYESAYDKCLESSDSAEDFDTAFAACMDKAGYSSNDASETETEESVEEDVMPSEGE